VILKLLCVRGGREEKIEGTESSKGHPPLGKDKAPTCWPRKAEVCCQKEGGGKKLKKQRPGGNGVENSLRFVLTYPQAWEPGRATLQSIALYDAKRFLKGGPDGEPEQRVGGGGARGENYSLKHGGGERGYILDGGADGEGSVRLAGANGEEGKKGSRGRRADAAEMPKK